MGRTLRMATKNLSPYYIRLATAASLLASAAMELKQSSSFWLSNWLPNSNLRRPTITRAEACTNAKLLYEVFCILRMTVPVRHWHALVAECPIA